MSEVAGSDKTSRPSMKAVPSPLSTTLPGIGRGGHSTPTVSLITMDGPVFMLENLRTRFLSATIL